MANLIPPRRGEFLTETGVATTRFAEYLEDVASNVNRASSSGDVFSSLNMSNAVAATLSKRIDDLELLVTLSVGNQLSKFATDYNIVVTDVDYTTTGKEIVICTNAAGVDINITLNTGAKDLEEVFVARQGASLGDTGNVSVIGPALGDTTMTIGTQYAAPHMIFINSVSSWVVV